MYKNSYPGLGLSGLSFLNGDGVSTSGSRNCGERGSESEISERGFKAKMAIKISEMRRFSYQALPFAF